MQQLELRTDDKRAALANALERELDMHPDDAREVSGLVLSAFDGREELDDEELSSDLRSVFYTIEDQNLLDFRREEERNEEGHLRRYFFWTIRWDEVTPDAPEGDDEGAEDRTVYDDLPQNAWKRGATG